MSGERAAKLNVEKYIPLVHFLYQAKVSVQIKYYDKACQTDKHFFRVHTKGGIICSICV